MMKEKENWVNEGVNRKETIKKIKNRDERKGGNE